MKKNVSVLLCGLLLLSFCGTLVPAGAADAPLTVTFGSPAICADAGETVTLTDWRVQFAPGETPVAAAQISWTDADGRALTSLTAPAAPGLTQLFAVSGTVKRAVYLVTKNPRDTDYVLYENDFSADPTAELRTVEQTSGASWKWDSAAGTLVLNASNSGSAYVRLLFPSYLDAFGDAVYEADLRLTNPNGGDSRWGSLMFRVQKNNYPYMQACIRYNATLSNGLEIAQRNESNAWNVMKTASGPAFVRDGFNRVRADYAGGLCSVSVGDREYLHVDSAYYTSGSAGLQVRGVTMTVDRVRICVNPRSSAEKTRISGGYAEVVSAGTHIALTPVLLSEIRAQSDLNSLLTDPPAVAVFDWDGTDVRLTDGTLPLWDAVDALQGKIVPAFRVRDAAAAKALAAALKKDDFRDAMLLVSDLAVFSAAWEQWNFLHAIYDARTFDGTAEELRVAAVSAGARCVIVPDAMQNRADIAHMQDRYLVCYAFSDGTASDTARLVNLGISGIVTAERGTAVRTMTDLYPSNTLTRYPNIIGHRGIPSQAQENSLAGCVKAFSLGACMVENDIYLCRDGVLMVMHDSTVDRTTDGSGAMTSLTSKQLAKFRIDSYAGAPTEPIPSLEDYFKTFKGNEKSIVIELKSDSTAPCKPLADMITQYGILDQVVVISFYEAPINALRGYLPGVSAAWLNSSVTPNENAVSETVSQLMDTLLPLKAVYSPSYAKGALGNKLVNALFARGITTWTWTVNSREDFDRYFVAGTRGITTNYADWAGSYIKELTGEIGTDGTVCVRAEKYAGTEADVTKNAVLKTVRDGGTGLSFDASSGKLTGTRAGTADVFFSYTAKTASGTSYAKVTELMSVAVLADGSVIPASALPETPGPEPESSAADTSGTLPETEPGTAPGTEPEKTSGCSSVLSAGVPLLLLAGCVLLRKKRN